MSNFIVAVMLRSRPNFLAKFDAPSIAVPILTCDRGNLVTTQSAVVVLVLAQT